MKKVTILILLLLGVFTASCGEGETENGSSESHVPKNKPGSDILEKQIYARQKVTTSKGTFTVIKYHDEEGNLKVVAYDSEGKQVDPNDFGAPLVSPAIEERLSERIKQTPEDEKETIVTIIVSLDDAVEYPEGLDEIGTIDQATGKLLVNGKEADASTLADYQKKQEELDLKYQEDVKKKRVSQIDKLIQNNPGLINTEQKYQYTETGILELDMAIGAIEAFYEKNKEIIVSISLASDNQVFSDSLPYWNGF